MVIDSDPMARKRRADLIIETTAGELRELLQEAVARLQPFPPLPGSFFTYGIEIEGGCVDSPERGCVILAPDGELYELELSIDFSDGGCDPVAARDETLKKLDLHPRDYIVFAYNALTRVTELLMEQESTE
ncbi:MAG: hypothetical protein QME71_05360 [Dehalococcoidia bacterium]|nr:hypothetical protein [Dehalococcoidia bacterium]